MSPLFDLVVPTVGRDSLATLLDRLAQELVGRAELGRIVCVDDRRAGAPELGVARSLLPVLVARGGGRGPAAARNTGLRHTSAEWVVFVDDDVVPCAGWGDALLDDLVHADEDVAGVQGRIVVPVPDRPTDWERNVAGLEHAWWATADMAYRRRVLLGVRGFDERFPRAYREDADLALRVLDRGYALRVGTRTVEHPVRPAPWWISIAKQAGNEDDALMRRLHGPSWRERAHAPSGELPRHVATTMTGATAATAQFLGLRAIARVAGIAWLAATARFAARRIAPGPRDAREISTMLATSVAIPPAATRAWLRGRRRAATAAPLASEGRPVEAVVLDRDGTIIVDVPYNGDPARVEAVPGAPDALARLRERGLPVAIATNQSGVARGVITRAEVADVNARVLDLLGPFDAVLVCPHGEDDGCSCRKPAPGLVLAAAQAVGADPTRCVVIGD